MLVVFLLECLSVYSTYFCVIQLCRLIMQFAPKSVFLKAKFLKIAKVGLLFSYFILKI